MSEVGERGGSPALYAMTAVCVIGALVMVLALLRRPPPPCGEAGCEGPPTLELPAAAVRVGDRDPEVTIALLVDFESAASRQVFAEITEVVGFAGLGVRSELLLLHAPAGGCTGEEATYRCLAARAIECAERLAPGSGARMAGVAFDMQWEAAAERGLVGLSRRAARFGIAGSSLERCVREEREVVERIAAHTAWARDRGLREAPAGFVIHAARPGRIAVFHGWLTGASLGRIVRCLGTERCEERRS